METRHINKSRKPFIQKLKVFARVRADGWLSAMYRFISAPLRFITPPFSPDAHWVLYPDDESMGGVIIGEPIAETSEIRVDRFLDRPVVYFDSQSQRWGSEVDDQVNNMVECVRMRIIVYITDTKDRYRRQAINIIGCFIKYWFKYNLIGDIIVEIDNIKKHRVCKKSLYHSDHIDRRLVEKYRPPKTVVILGASDSEFQIEEYVDFELRSLPKYSTIIHGDRPGIDSYTAQKAKGMGLNTKLWPITSKERDDDLLNTEHFDYIAIFHYDIENAKNTKRFLIKAYEHLRRLGRRLEIYIISERRRACIHSHFERTHFGNLADL